MFLFGSDEDFYAEINWAFSKTPSKTFSPLFNLIYEALL